MNGYIDFNIDDHREDYHHMQTYISGHCFCCYQVQCMPIENHTLLINPEKRSNQSKPIYQLQGIERESPYFCYRLPAKPTQKVVNPTQTRD